MGRAVRIAGRSRYRLVATFASGEQAASRDEFESIPAAQSEVGPFVCEIAQRGRPTAIHIERITHDSNGQNGKAHPHRATGETLRRWDETVVDRILRQHLRQSDAPCEPAPCAREIHALPREPSPPPMHVPAAPSEPADAPQPVAFVAMPGTAESVDAPVHDLVVPESQETQPAAAPPDTRDAFELSHLLRIDPEYPAPAVAPEVSRAAVAVATEQRASAYRPHHRRTRWVLILTAAFIAILFGGMILLETNGDPIGYFRRVGSGEKMRETLPFRNGKGATTKPAGRT